MTKKIVKKTNPELKEALKNEVAPFLIGLRNEMKGTNALLEKLAGKDMLQALELVFNGEKVPMLKGKDAYNPQRGVDYWTEEDKAYVISNATPTVGKDYFTASQQKEWLKKVTPIKGLHFTDGYTPKAGKDFYTKEDRQAFIKEVLELATPIKGLHYRDGKDGVTKTVVEYVAVNPVQVREALEKLKGKARPSVKILRDFEAEVLKIVAMNKGQGNASAQGGIGGGGGIDLPSQTGQAGKYLTTNGSSLSWGTVSAGATPAGADTNVQYNDGGSALGGDANFIWNKTSKKLTLTSQSVLTIGNVLSASATQQNGSYGLFADGYGYQFSVYAYKTVGANNVYSSTPYILNPTDDSGGVTFRWQLSWGAVTGATGYVVVVDNDDWNGYYGTVSLVTGSTSANYDGLGGGFLFGTPTITPSSPASVYNDALLVAGNEVVSGTSTIASTVFAQSNLAVGGTNQKGKLTVTYDNASLSDSSGTNTAIFLNNPNAGGQTIFQMNIAGSPQMAIRADFVGDLNWISYATDPTRGHAFYVTGDYPNPAKMLITSAGISLGNNVTSQTPTARLDFEAGTSSAKGAPLRWRSGPLLATPITGAHEFLTDKWYGTINTGTARKEFTLNDIALTAGRVPFSTTNGRLTDDADFTFATDTLTVTKIAATTFTGDVTHSAVNLVTDTTTGMKIGTSTTQKIGFFNATPVVQQTNTTEIGVLLSNLGLRASGTAYPITTSGAVTLGSLTSGRVTFAGASGLLSDDADLTFATDTLTSTKIKVKQGTGSGTATVGGSIFDHYADAGNVTTGETDLYSDAIPVNTLGNNGDKLSAVYGLNLVNSTSTKQVKLYYAGTVIFDTGALTLSASGSLVIECEIIRVGSSTLRYSITASTTGASTATYATVGELTGVVFGKGSQTMKITGQAAGVGAATNDIIAKMSRIIWMAAA